MNPNILIDVSKIPTILQQNYEFIDIRDVTSYKQEHLQKFKNLPIQNKEKIKPYINKEKPTIFICYTGTQSYRLAEALNAEGYHCYSIHGGFYNVKNYNKNTNYY